MMADKMYLKKASFIAFELENLVRKIDDDIVKLEPIANDSADDVVAVAVWYGDGSGFKVNVECDSLSAIVIDVIKRIQ